MDERILDHVGIAVASIDDALPIWTALTGLEPADREIVTDQSVEVVFLGSDRAQLELLAPTAPTSAIARFLDRRGPGLHHLCYRVPDLRAALTAHEEAGFELIDREPRLGARNHLVAFLHPRAAGGVLIELIEAY
jgi:methylmalonyl-CoA epimerase